MNQRDIAVAKGLLYVIGFIVVFYLTSIALDYLWPNLSSYMFFKYLTCAGIAAVAAVAPVRHFFPT